LWKKNASVSFDREKFPAPWISQPAATFIPDVPKPSLSANNDVHYWKIKAAATRWPVFGYRV
jgi:hypothetical protein